jgi:ubiquinone biosynthesis protein
VVPVINFIRIILLFLLFLPVYFFNKNYAVFCFLRLAGPSFIKLGQLLSVRPDLIGEKLAAVLAVFQDNLLPFSQKKVKAILAQEFGDSYEKIFIEFNFVPAGSASIAQVYKAKLSDGNDVAVKILRPNIAKIIKRDIATLKLLIKFSGIFDEFLARSLSDIADILQRAAKDELNLLNEAANSSRLKEDLKNIKGFYVPQIFWQFSTSKILVLEWLDGIAFSNKNAILNFAFEKKKIDKKKIAQNLVISYFNQVYVHGFFHADMHPGNLFLLKNGDIGVVDFGIMGKIDKKTRLAVAEILIGFLNKDYKKIARIHLQANLVPPQTNIDDLALSCRKIGETIVGSSVKDISAASLLANLIIMMRDYKMATRPELLLLQKTLMLVEGVGVMLDPDLNIWDLARPWVKEWARKNIGFDAKIRDTIFDLLASAKKMFMTC